jgi:molybdenum cofactor biosynthesis enzyme MoaA
LKVTATMKIYSLLKLYNKVKSTRLKLFGLYVLHVTGRRYMGVFFDPNLGCNLRCRMCYFSDEEVRRQKVGVLSMADVETIARALFHRALKLQIGCGAEPTLYKDLAEVVRLGKRYGVPYISITTNGKLLSREMLESLLQAGLDEVTISVHGMCRETYERLMTNGSFDLFEQLLENLKVVKQEYPKMQVRVNYTMNEDNVAELALFDKVFEGVPVNVLQLRPIQRIGKSAYDNFNLKGVEEAYDEVLLPLVERCREHGVVCLVPPREELQAGEMSGKPDVQIFEDLTYCYVSPQSCWRDDFDYHTDTFDSFCHRHRVGRLILRNVFWKKKNFGERTRVTRSLGYKVE